MIRRRVLAVDDESGMQSFYEEFFGTVYRSEFIAHVAGDGPAALIVSRREPLDLAIVDWTMPGMSGIELIRALRSDPKTSGLAILMVTARTQPEAICGALELGADDHLAKPFDERVLLARLRSLSRRRDATRHENQVYRCDGLELDASAKRLLIDGQEVHLKPKEMDMLCLLLERPNVILSNAFLWDSIGSEELENWRRNLIVTMSNLRIKLGARWGSRIECHKNQGYLLRR